MSKTKLFSSLTSIEEIKTFWDIQLVQWDFNIKWKFPSQTLRQIGQGVPDLWSDIRAVYFHKLLLFKLKEKIRWSVPEKKFTFSLGINSFFPSIVYCPQNDWIPEKKWNKKAGKSDIFWEKMYKRCKYQKMCIYGIADYT